MLSVASLLGVLEPVSQVSPLAMSGDGRRVAMTFRRRRDQVGSKAAPGESPQRSAVRGARVFVVDIATGRMVQAGPEGHDSFRPAWRPDGSAVAFVAAEPGGEPCVWWWEVSSGLARRVPPWSVGMEMFASDRPRWSSDGRFVYACVRRPAGGAVEERRAVVENAHGVRVLTAADDAAARTGGQLLPPSLVEPLDVARFDVTDGTVERLESGLPARAVYPSPSGRWLAIRGPLRQPDPDSGRLEEDVWVMPAAGGAAVAAVFGLASDVNATRHEPVWAPTEDRLAVIDDAELVLVDATTSLRRVSLPADTSPSLLYWAPVGDKVLVGARGALVVGDPDSGQWTTLTRPAGRTPLVPARAGAGAQFVCPDGVHLLGSCSTADGARGELWRVPLDGTEPERVFEVDGLVNAGSSSLAGDNFGDANPGQATIVFSVQAADRPFELWATDASLSAPHRVATVSISVNRQLGRTWRPPDAKGPPMAALVPPHGEGPWPAVISLYPGASPVGLQRWGAGAIVPHQLLASAGYAVVVPGLLGGTGPMPGLPPEGLVAAVDAIADRAVAAGVADQDRMAVIGHSAGAWMVNLLLTRTRRFRAGISSSGIADLATFHSHLAVTPDSRWQTYGTHIAQWLATGPPWEHPEHYLELSPLYHLADCHTPLLLIHGTDDPASPWQQSALMFTALNRLGTPATLALYEAEKHVPTQFSPVHQEHIADLVVGFLAEHLLE